MAQSVKRRTSAQVMISQFVSSSPASGSGLTAQSLEPASDSVSPSICDPPLLILCLSLKINKNVLKIKKNKTSLIRGTWLAQSVERVTLDLEVVNSSPMLGVKITLKNKIFF